MFIKKLCSNIFNKLPARYWAILQYYLRPSVRKGWGGSLNGQIKRQEMFQEMIKFIPFNAIVETGTFLGATSEFFAHHTTIPIYTVEHQPRFYHYSRLRLRNFTNVHVFLGDSRTFLKMLQEDSSFHRKGILFYLDAHWSSVLPLQEEIYLITKSWEESIIVIDDFQVPDDHGYGFDDYGEGKCLCIEDLKLTQSSYFEIFWPSAQSSVETGKRRGCIILATKDSAFEKSKSIKSLRFSREFRYRTL